MQYRTIQGTDLNVSLLGFGNFTFGAKWWTDADDNAAVAVQNGAFDLGVNFFDTAPAYGNYRAEKLLGETIKYAGRDNVVVSTKFGYDLVTELPPSPSPKHRERPQDYSAKAIRAELERSLGHMGVDCIDLWQAHNIKLKDLNDELFETLEALRDEGKIRYYGVALGPAIGWRHEGHQAMLKYKCHTVQTVYNVYEQAPGRELCEITEETKHGGVLIRVPTNSGMLDNEFESVSHVFGPNDHRKYRDRNWLKYGIEKNKMLLPLAESLGLTLGQFALRWLAGHPTVSSIEPNLLTIEDVKSYAVGCTGETLPDDIMKQLAEWYATDYGMGDEAHPCDCMDSCEGTVRSDYVAPDYALQA